MNHPRNSYPREPRSRDLDDPHGDSRKENPPGQYPKDWNEADLRLSNAGVQSYITSRSDTRDPPASIQYNFYPLPNLMIIFNKIRIQRRLLLVVFAGSLVWCVSFSFLFYFRDYLHNSYKNVLVGEKAMLHKTKKNVVFILIDDLGAMDFACYQDPNEESYYSTPNIDKLAERGVMFRNSYSSAPTCSLSRAGIFTGTSPSRLGMFKQSLARYGMTEEKACFFKYNSVTLPFNRSTQTLGMAFASHGYQTAFVGKWHNCGTPGDNGFSVSKGYVDTSYDGATGTGINTHFSPYTCNGTRYCKTQTPKKTPLANMEVDVEDGSYAADHLTLEAMKTMKDFNDSSSPFLLVLSHYAVHYPMESKPLYEKAFREKAKVMNLEKFEGKYEKGVYTRTLRNDPTYAGMLKSVDDSVGKIAEELQRLGIQNDTIVVLTSDNGGLASDPMYRLHPPTSNMPYDLGKVYLGEGGIRVPLIISSPGQLKEGTESYYQSVGTDIFPTLLDMAGLPLMPNDHIDGRSLLPAMDNSTLIRKEPIFWQADYEDFNHKRQIVPTAVTWGNFKLLERYASGSVLENPTYELYNIKTDPGEKHDHILNNGGNNTCQFELLYKKMKQWQSTLFDTRYYKNVMEDWNCNATTDISRTKFVLDSKTRVADGCSPLMLYNTEIDNIRKKGTRPLEKMTATYFSRRENILASIKNLRELIAAATLDGEKEAYKKALKLEIDALGRIDDEEMKSQRFESMGAIVEGKEGV